MCFFSQPRVVQQAPAPVAPKKSSTEVQKETEDRIVGLGLAQNSFASTIFTSGLGDTSSANISGVTLGV